MAERSKYEHGIPEGGLQHIAGQLADLMRHPAWPEYLELLQGARVVTRENLETCEPHDIPHWRGYLQGIKAAAELPLTVLADAEEQVARDAGKAPGAAAAARFFNEHDGSPSFGG